MNYLGLIKNDKSKLLAIISIIIIGLSLQNPLTAKELKVLHEKTFNVSKGQMLELYADVGDVKVNSWEKNELYVKVLGNDRAEEKLEFEFVTTENGVKITAKKEGSSWFSWFSSIKLKFEIMVPSEFDSNIRTAGGDVIFSDIFGNSDIRTSGGDVKLRGTGGDLLLKTSGGDIEVVNHNGDAEMGTSGGDINVDGLMGNIDASTSGGDVKMNIVKGKVEAGTSGGDISLSYSGPNMGIFLSTSGGNIHVYLPGDIQASADLRTSGGDIECSLPATRTNKVSSSKFEGEINGGGNVIRCKTSGGDIILKEKS